MLLRPADVHPHQHLGPVRGVDAAGAGADGHDRLALVVLPREQGPDLHRLDVLAQLLAAPRRPRPVSSSPPSSAASSYITGRSSSRCRSSSTRRSSPWACDSSLVTFWAWLWSSHRLRIGRLVLELLDPGRVDRRHRAPAPPSSGWCRGRRCRLAGRDPREFRVPWADMRPFSTTRGNRRGSPV